MAKFDSAAAWPLSQRLFHSRQPAQSRCTITAVAFRACRHVTFFATGAAIIATATGRGCAQRATSIDGTELFVTTIRADDATRATCKAGFDGIDQPSRRSPTIAP